MKTEKLLMIICIAVWAVIAIGLRVDARPLQEIRTGDELAQIEDGLQEWEYRDLINRIARKYHISGRFVNAVAILESGWGRSGLARTNNNLFGIRSRDSYKVFDSAAECVDYTCRLLREKYISPDGVYYHGGSVEGVCKRYNGSVEWTRLIRELMR